MVYESDFYTVRRPYSRPTITSYSVTRRGVPWEKVPTVPRPSQIPEPFTVHGTKNSYYAEDGRRSPPLMGVGGLVTSAFDVRIYREQDDNVFAKNVLVTNKHRRRTSPRTVLQGCRPCLSMRNAIAPQGTHSNVRMSVLLGELNRIQHRHRPHLGYVPTEDFLCSRPLVEFDDEAKHIRAAADKLIRYVHTSVPHETSRPRLVTAYDRYTPEGRYISKYSDVPTNIQCMSYYTEPSRVTIGRGHLACMSYAGGRGYPRRKHLYSDETRDIGDEIKFRSYYSRNIHPSRTDDALLLPTGFASRILLPDRRLLPASEGRAIVFQSKLVRPAGSGLSMGRAKPEKKVERTPKQKTRAQAVEDEVLAESMSYVPASYQQPEVEREVVPERVRSASPEPEPERVRPASPELEPEPEPTKEPTPPPVDVPKPKKDKKPLKTVHYEPEIQVAPEPVEEPSEDITPVIETTEPVKDDELDEEPYLSAAVEEIVADVRAVSPEVQATALSQEEDALPIEEEASQPSDEQPAVKEYNSQPMEIEKPTSEIEEERQPNAAEEPFTTDAEETPIETDAVDVVSEQLVEEKPEVQEEEEAQEAPIAAHEEESIVNQSEEKESMVEDESTPIAQDSESDAAHIADEVTAPDFTPNDTQAAEDAIPAIDQDTCDLEANEDQLDETPVPEDQTSRLQDVPDDESLEAEVEDAPTNQTDDQELPEPTPDETPISEMDETPTSETPEPIIEEPLTPTQE